MEFGGGEAEEGDGGEEGCEGASDLEIRRRRGRLGFWLGLGRGGRRGDGWV